MVRAPFYDGSGLKKGAWSLEEDNKLRAYIERYGHGNWRELPKFAGISRCGKSCRLRWTNYLQPGVKRGHYTQQEDELIIRLHEEFGNKWSIIAAKLPGRTDNDIKNHWHTHIGNRTKQNPTSSQVKEQSCDESPPSETRRNSELEAQSASVHQIFESSPLSPSETFSSTEYSSLSCNDHGPVSTINCLADEDSLASSMSETILEDSSGDFWTQPFQQDSMYVQSNYPIISYSELGEQEGILSSPYVMLYDIIDGMDLFYQVMPKFQDN